MSEPVETRITTGADPEVRAAIDVLVKHSALGSAALSVYTKSVEGVPCVLAVAIGSMVGSMLVTSVGAIRQYVEGLVLDTEREAKH